MEWLTSLLDWLPLFASYPIAILTRTAALVAVFYTACAVGLPIALLVAGLFARKDNRLVARNDSPTTHEQHVTWKETLAMLAVLVVFDVILATAWNPVMASEGGQFSLPNEETGWTGGIP